MKAKVTVFKMYDGGYGVRLAVEVQSFFFDYEGTKAEAQWYARMVRIALKKIGKKP